MGRVRRVSVQRNQFRGFRGLYFYGKCDDSTTYVNLSTFSVFKPPLFLPPLPSLAPLFFLSVVVFSYLFDCSGVRRQGTRVCDTGEVRQGRQVVWAFL